MGSADVGLRYDLMFKKAFPLGRPFFVEEGETSPSVHRHYSCCRRGKERKEDSHPRLSYVRRAVTAKGHRHLWITFPNLDILLKIEISRNSKNLSIVPRETNIIKHRKIFNLSPLYDIIRATNLHYHP